MHWCCFKLKKGVLLEGVSLFFVLTLNLNNARSSVNKTCGLLFVDLCTIWRKHPA